MSAPTPLHEAAGAVEKTGRTVTKIRAAGRLLAAVLVMGLASRGARAQQTPSTEQSRYGSAAVYRYADPDEVTIRVNVWGAVQNAGIYEVPRDAHLNMLFSAAGGPQVGIRERVDTQTIIVRLLREDENGERQVIYSQTMDDEITVTKGNPPLQDGDILTVNSYVVQGVNWRDVLSIGSSLITLGLTIINFATR